MLRHPGDFDGQPGTRIRVFTTRPDTLFGGTYVVLAPEHALVDRITVPAQQDAVAAYRVEVGKKSERDRATAAADAPKSGVFTGAYAVNPVNGAQIPIWIADYVLASYGTGAVFACPAHDERDHSFAKTFDLRVMDPELRAKEQGTLDAPGFLTVQSRVDALEITPWTLSEVVEEYQKF